MEATCLAFGLPAWAAAEKFLHIHFNEANIATPICTYFPSPGSLGWSFTIKYVVDVL